MRCGVCCNKGGPALHLEDKSLVEKGIIQIRHLYTIRAGEKAIDNVMGGHISVASDIIKVKGVDHFTTCIFFNETDDTCKIYRHRPVECRILKCWDVEPIMGMYAQTRLSRKDLLVGITKVWDLVEHHEARCSHEKISRLIDGLTGDTSKQALVYFSELLNYDRHLRLLLTQKAGLKQDMLDFLFGRPLFNTIQSLGLQVVETRNKFRITLPHLR